MRKLLTAVTSALFALVPEMVYGALREDGVLVLNDHNFDKELKAHPQMLVEFYAPWCGHCKQLAPEYAKAAQILAEQDQYLAKIDATENHALANRFDLQGYPSIFFFENGVKEEYTGSRDANGIVKWMTKRTGQASQEVQSCDDLKYKLDARLNLVYYGEFKGQLFDVFMKVAKLNDDYMFFHAKCYCPDQDGIDHPSISIHRSFDQSPVHYDGDVNVADVAGWLDLSSMPSLIDFAEEYIDTIFEQHRDCLILVTNDKQSRLSQVYQEAASELQGMLLFIRTGTEDDIQTQFAEFLGVDYHTAPVLYLLSPNRDMGKYKYDSPLDQVSVDSIYDFIHSFKSGSLIAKRMSEPEVPFDEQGVVLKLVGTTFEDLVYDNTLDVWVMIYAPWCDHCKAMMGVWEQLGNDMFEHEDLVIAKFDLEANEVPGVDVEGYPTLRWYPKGNKNGIDYTGQRNMKSFMNFLGEYNPAYNQAGQYYEQQQVHPGSAPVYDEEADPNNLVKVLTSQNFNRIVMDEDKDVFVKFYAPWCGHCKNLEPIWKEFAQKASGKTDLVVAKFDHTVEYVDGLDLKSYPTLRFYPKGNKKGIDYSGGRNVWDFSNYVNDQQGQAWADDESTNDGESMVTILDSKNYHRIVMDESKHVFVKYYAPWCGHCQSLAPTWDELADRFGDDDDIVIAKLDHTAHQVQGLEITGYPTLKYFPKGNKKGIDYQGQRNVWEFVNFMNDHSDDLGAANPKPIEESDGAVVILNSYNFDSVVFDNSKNVFVKFYAPWCGHCQNMAPAWREFAEMMEREQDDVVVAKIDWTEHQIPGIEISGFPSLKYYPKNNKGGIDYQGQRQVWDFVNFMTQKNQAASQSQDQEGDGNVVVLTDSNFKQIVMDTSKHVFVKFYAPWCGHCQNMAPAWRDLADEFDRDDVVIAKIDWTAFQINGINIEGFPTLKFYPKDNKEGIDYLYSRQVHDMLNFMRQNTDDLGDDDGVPDEESDGNVVVLSKWNFDDIVYDETKHVFVKFYAPWCGHCMNMAPAWRDLADLMIQSDDVIIAKLDATEHEISSIHISGFPSLKYFPKTNKKGIDYNGQRAVRDWVSFMDQNSDGIEYDRPAEESDGNVVVLNNFNFNEVVNDPSKNVFVKFYAPWCGHCQNMAPAWAEFADKMLNERDDIVVAKIDWTQYQIPGIEIKGFPSLKYYSKDNKDGIDYQGQRNVWDFANFVAQQSGGSAGHHQQEEENDGAVVVLNSFNFNGIVMDDSKDVFVKFYAPWCGHCKNMAPAWRELAEMMEREHEDVVIAKIDSTEHQIPGLDISGFPTLRYYPKGNKNGIAYQGGRQMWDFVNFMSQNSDGMGTPQDEDHGKVVVLDAQNFHDIVMDETKDVFVKFYAPWCGHCKNMAPTWMDLADKVSDNSDVIIAKFDADAQDVRGVEITGFPTLIMYPKGNKKGVQFQGHRSFWDLVNFMSKEVDGFTMADNSLEEEQEQQGGPVRVLGASNFDKVVNDRTKDVFVMVYAPWCEHCKKMEPTWERFATKNAEFEDLIIAKLDHTKNQLPQLQIKGFPTLIMFPKHDKQGYEYSGVREVYGFEDFLYDHSCVFREDCPPAAEGDEPVVEAHEGGQQYYTDEF